MTDELGSLAVGVMTSDSTRRTREPWLLQVTVRVYDTNGAQPDDPRRESIQTMTIFLSSLGVAAWIAAGISYHRYGGAHLDTLVIVGAIFTCAAEIIVAINGFHRRFAQSSGAANSQQLDLIADRLRRIENAIEVSGRVRHFTRSSEIETLE